MRFGLRDKERCCVDGYFDGSIEGSRVKLDKSKLSGASIQWLVPIRRHILGRWAGRGPVWLVDLELGNVGTPMKMQAVLGPSAKIEENMPLPVRVVTSSVVAPDLGRAHCASRPQLYKLACQGRATPSWLWPQHLTVWLTGEPASARAQSRWTPCCAKTKRWAKSKTPRLAASGRMAMRRVLLHP
jgi:hypothetical protein